MWPSSAPGCSPRRPLSTVADAVSRLAPAGVRGEATGLQSSALSAGFALGSPLVGVAIDLSVPAGGFAAAGLAGLAAALTGYLLSRRSPAVRRNGGNDAGSLTNSRGRAKPVDRSTRRVRLLLGVTPGAYRKVFRPQANPAGA